MNIPLEMPKDKDNYNSREKYIKEGMFGFVSWKWVNPLVEWIGNKKCLEVMAGRGILSYALKQKGVNIITTDDYSWHKLDKFKKWNETLVEIEEIDAVEAVEKYGKNIDILIMSWPYMDDTAHFVIKKLYETNPNALVVYIGERSGGCTANDKFFEHFKILKDEKFELVIKNYERWSSVYDEPTLGKFYITDKKERLDAALLDTLSVI